MKKKIMIITDVMSIGGVERVIVNTLNGIDYDKFNVTLFIMYKTLGEKSNLSKIPNKVRIHYLFQKPIKGIYQRMLYYLFMFLPGILINKFIVKEEFDIIITTKDVFTYPISSIKCHKVMWIHEGLEHLENEEPTILNRFKRYYKKRTYSKFNKIITLTTSAENRFCRIYNLKERCCVVHNPINHEEIIRLSNESVSDHNFNTAKVTIVCSSRLSIEKGVERLIHACSRLLNEGCNFNLIILGDGPEKNKLNDIILQNSLLSNNITILGFKENPYKYMRKCSIYVSPSFTEGFPLSIAEAIILNLPVLSTTCNGTAEVLENGKYGMLVDNSEEGIYEGLSRMLLEPELVKFYRLKSKERIEFFSFEKNIAALEKVFNG